MTRTCLVTGGAGFVGRSVCALLRERGVRIRTLDLSPLDPADAHPEIEHFRGDIRDSTLVHRAAAGADLVVHAAAALPLWKPDEILSINVQGTRSVLQAAADQRIPRVVHVSTTAVYGAPGIGPLLETDPLEAIDPYSRSKIEAEAVVRSFADRVCVPILRAKLVVGPGRLGIFDLVFDWARRGKHIPVLGSGDNLYQMLHVEDLSAAIWSAAIGPPDTVADVFNVAAERFGTVRQDFQALLNHAGFARRVVPLPEAPAKAALWILEHVGLSPLSRSVYGAAGKVSFVSVEKARRRLGWAPRYSNADALVHSYDWYVKHYEEFQGRSGTTHRSPLRQGALAVVRAFF
jgi:nucleoside-diphosphate-sugar epimerase